MEYSVLGLIHGSLLRPHPEENSGSRYPLYEKQSVAQCFVCWHGLSTMSDYCDAIKLEPFGKHGNRVIADTATSII